MSLKTSIDQLVSNAQAFSAQLGTLTAAVQSALGYSNAAAASAASAAAIVLGTKVSTNQFEIAGSSMQLPAFTFVASCFHLAKDDTDKGDWRKRKGQSWRGEVRSAGRFLGTHTSNYNAVNTLTNGAYGAVGDYFVLSSDGKFYEITGFAGTAPNASSITTALTRRAGREDYPTNALITAEAARIIIWDLDGSQPTMWKVFTNNGSGMTGGYAVAASTITSIAALNNTVVFGQLNTSSRGGVYVIDFMADCFLRINTVVGSYPKFGGNLAQANTALGYPVYSSTKYSASAIGNQDVNSVAISILPDAPLDEFGMPTPTIAVGTAGGVSVIKNDCSIVNSSYTGSVNRVSMDSRNLLYDIPTSFSGFRGVPLAGISASFTYTETYTNTTIPASGNLFYRPTLAGNVTAIYGSNGLELFLRNEATGTLSSKAVISSTYNSGWMVGDIRRCVGYDSASALADKSVKASAGWAAVGSPTITPVTGGNSAVSGFSNANYLQEASHADWNALGTGDFSIIMSGVKWGTTATLKTLFSIGDGVSNGSLKLEQLAANTLRLSIYNAGAWTAVCTSTATFVDTTEHVLSVKRYTQNGVASTCAIVVDGVVVASAVSALTISNATGFFRVGEGQDVSQPWAGGQFSGYVRISATAPTAEQSKFIYATEGPLAGGAACLLSNSNSVSAVRYDKVTGLLHAGNGTNIDEFKVLNRVNSYAHGLTTLATIPAENGFKFRGGTTGGTYSAPARNINAELLEHIRSDRKPVAKMISSDALSKLSFPAGMKPTRVISAAGTYISLSANAAKFDGFIWYLDTGLAALTNYDCELVEA